MARDGEIVRAGVVAGGVNTRYLGAGRGAPVLVLSQEPARRLALLEQLPRGFRVVAPELSTSAHPSVASPDFTAWLGFFLEALGLWGVTVVADEVLAGPAVDMALAEPERVSSLVMMQHGLRDDVSPEGGDGAHVGRLPNGVPVFAAWVGAGEAESLTRALPQIRAFLGRPRAED